MNQLLAGTIGNVDLLRVSNLLGMLARDIDTSTDVIASRAPYPERGLEDTPDVRYWHERMREALEPAFGDDSPITRVAARQMQDAETLRKDPGIDAARIRARIDSELRSLDAIRSITTNACYAMATTPVTSVYVAIAQVIELARPVIRRIQHQKIEDGFGDMWGTSLKNLSPIYQLLGEIVLFLNARTVDLEADMQQQHAPDLEEMQEMVQAVLDLIVPEEMRPPATLRKGFQA